VGGDVGRTPRGRSPTGTVPTTVSVVVSISVTSPEPSFVTISSRDPAGGWRHAQASTATSDTDSMGSPVFHVGTGFLRRRVGSGGLASS
jgi:hypothetical protein